MKKLIIVLIAIAAVSLVWYFMSNNGAENAPVGPEVVETASTTVITEPAMEPTGETVIGKSVEGRDLIAYRFGTGENKVLFVGGLHGGYSWNTSLLGFELVNYLKANPTAVPENTQALVIPVANPDGLFKVAGTAGTFTAASITASADVQVAGRFNANKVDLNRNFDCQWKPTGKWQSTTVSGGSAAFSEPESLAIKNYVESQNPDAVIVWYSAAGGVYASACGGAVSAETTAMTDTYAKASGYKAYQSFDYYETSGDMVNWLAKSGIPAISVLLTDHKSTEWTKNLAGIEAVLKANAQ